MPNLEKELYGLIQDVIKGTRTLTRAAQKLRLEISTLHKLKPSFRTKTLVRLLVCEMPQAKELAKRILRERGFPPAMIDTVEATDHVISYAEVAKKFGTQKKQARSVHGLMDFYMHAALQLETVDFPGGELAAALLGESDRNAVQAAAAADLIYCFVNASYFSSIARVLWSRQRDPKNKGMPVHPFNMIGLEETYVTPDAKYWKGKTGETLRAMGQGPREIFQQKLPTFEVGMVPSIEEGRTAYGYLYELCQFGSVDCEVAEARFVLASASVAAFRATIAALSAAGTIVDFGSGGEVGEPLYSLALKIRELSHYTYLLKFEDAAASLKQLPEPHQGYIARDYAMTVRALGDDEGVWFIVLDSQQAYVSQCGSVLFGARGARR
jgi:hypothetical protein